MNSLGLAFRDRVRMDAGYRDLRDRQDDKTVLNNPHKGWYWHYIDNGYGRGNYRELHDPQDTLADFPGLNHLYLRYDWGDIEKREGVYDWSYIDEIMKIWGDRGYRFSMRVCTYEGSGEGVLAYATPPWVYEAGAAFTEVRPGVREPDYGDPVFLEKLSSFMEEYGRRFNGHPLLETIDIGTYGTWGEGHTGNGSEKVWPLEVMQKHIDLHTSNFPDTFVQINDDFLNHRNIRGDAENIALLEYARDRGVGICEDSVCVAYYSEHCGYNTLRTPFLFDYFWKQAPVDLEFEHYQGMKDEVFKDGLPFLEAMRRTHATFAGFHGYPRPWLEKEFWLTEYCANRLGYWYFIEGAVIPSELRQGMNRISLVLSNRGFAPCYWKYDAKLRLLNRQTGKAEVFLLDLDNRRWMPEATAEESFPVVLRNVTPGEYEISFGLFEKDRPIRLGMKTVWKDAGFYELGTVTVTG